MTISPPTLPVFGFTDANEAASKLVTNFPCCPIANGLKYPAGYKGWEQNPVRTWNGVSGLGVICGQVSGFTTPVYGFDVDVTHEAAAAEFEALLQTYMPNRPTRVGQAPKSLTPFVLADGEPQPMHKFETGDYYPDGNASLGKAFKCELEILGHGNQFVAYHVHPDTQKPYQWFGDQLYNLTPGDLPVLTREQLGELKDKFNDIMLAHGLKLATGIGKGSQSIAKNTLPADSVAVDGVAPFGFQFLATKKIKGSLEELEHWTSLMPDEAAADGEFWFTVAKAAHYITGGGQDGYDALDEFSQRWPDKYHPAGNETRYFSLKPNHDNPTTVASVRHMVLLARPELAREDRNQEALPKPDEIGEGALSLKTKIENRLMAEWAGFDGIELGHITDPAVFEVDAAVLHLIVTGAFWRVSGGSGKSVSLLNSNDDLNVHGEASAYRMITRKFGHPFNISVVEKLAIYKYEAEGRTSSKENFISARVNMVGAEIRDYLEYHNQRGAVNYSVDMFAERSRMELEEESVRVHFKHRELKPRSLQTYYPEVIADYLQHFTRFHEFLEFILAARFASDRKKAYLWVNAGSDWGKGFLMSALGGEGLGISVDLSMSEVEMMGSGSPVGRSPSDFKRAMVLNLNEVKGIKRELKELESSLSLSPKFQLASTVAIFAKILWSAEPINSLVGESGVEDQLANRISIFKEDGTVAIHDRELYKKLGGGTYHASVVRYIADYMNTRINEYVALGREAAEKVAQEHLSAFHKQYGVGKMFGVISDSLDDIANEILDDIRRMNLIERAEAKVFTSGTIGSESEVRWLGAPRRFVDNWIYNRYSHSERTMYSFKVPEILKLMSASGTGEVVGISRKDVVGESGGTRKLLELR